MKVSCAESSGRREGPTEKTLDAILIGSLDLHVQIQIDRQVGQRLENRLPCGSVPTAKTLGRVGSDPRGELPAQSPDPAPGEIGFGAPADQQIVPVGIEANLGDQDELVQSRVIVGIGHRQLVSVEFTAVAVCCPRNERPRRNDADAREATEGVVHAISELWDSVGVEFSKVRVMRDRSVEPPVVRQHWEFLDVPHPPGGLAGRSRLVGGHRQNAPYRLGSAGEGDPVLREGVVGFLVGKHSIIPGDALELGFEGVEGVRGVFGQRLFENANANFVPN